MDLLISQLQKYQAPVNLSAALRSTTLDIITSYCYGRSYDAITHSDFKHPILDGMEATFYVVWLFKHFRFTIPLLMGMPIWALKLVSPEIVDFSRLRLDIMERIDSLLKDRSSLDHAEHETIYHHLLSPQGGKIQHETPSRKCLISEAINLLLAESDTIRNACVVGTFHVLNDRGIHSKLLTELDNAWPDKNVPIKYEVLEKLPYLVRIDLALTVALIDDVSSRP